jgi:hypothetical protein
MAHSLLSSNPDLPIRRLASAPCSPCMPLFAVFEVAVSERRQWPDATFIRSSRGPLRRMGGTVSSE